MPNLPKLCYTRVLGNEPGNRMGIIKRDVDGYYHCDYDQVKYTDEQVEEYVNILNERLKVTKEQRLAMEIGSMFGWHVPGANPEAHDGMFDNSQTDKVA